MGFRRSHPYARCSSDAVGEKNDVADEQRRARCSNVDGILGVPSCEQESTCVQAHDVELSAEQAPGSLGDFPMRHSDPFEFVFGAPDLPCACPPPVRFSEGALVSHPMDSSFAEASRDDCMGRLDRNGSVFGHAALIHEPCPPVNSEMLMQGVAVEPNHASQGRSDLQWYNQLPRASDESTPFRSMEASGCMETFALPDTPATPRRNIGAKTKFTPPPLFSDEPSPPLREALRRNSESEVGDLLAGDSSLATEPFMDHECEPPLCYATRIGCSARIIELLLESGAQWSDSDIRGRRASDPAPPLRRPVPHFEYLQYFDFDLHFRFD